VLVSRWYFEAVTRVAEDYTQLFSYQGSRTDKHVREHEIYAVASANPDALDLAARRQRARPASPPDLRLVQSEAAEKPGRDPSIWRQKLPHIAAALSCLILVIAIVAYYVDDRASGAANGSVKFAPAIRLAEPPQHPASAPASTAHAAEPEKAPPLPDKPVPVATVHTSKRSGAQKPAPAEDTAIPVTAKPATPATAVSPWTNGGDTKPGAEPREAHAGSASSPYTGAAGKSGTALVMLAVSPWGEVVVDGKPAGVSPPLAELELTPGTHQLTIRNGAFAAHEVTLQLEANQTIRIKHKFTQR
jgi:hypothetical protein